MSDDRPKAEDPRPGDEIAETTEVLRAPDSEDPTRVLRIPSPPQAVEPPTEVLPAATPKPPTAKGTAKPAPPRPARPAATVPPTRPAPPIIPPQPEPEPDPTLVLALKKKKRSKLRTMILVGLALALMTSGVGLAGITYYADKVPVPSELTLPEATTIWYADGKTPMAKLGKENRSLLTFDQMDDAVKASIVAAEDKSFWTNDGIDFKGVLRAAWNNVSGGDRQGASTITQQYARVAAELTGVTYSRKLREAVIAYKMTKKYSKQQILEFYLNTVPFGRGTYGIEAAANVFMGKSARKGAPNELTLADAMVLAAMVKQPERDPSDPEGTPGYDPTRNATALANSQARWAYIKTNLVPYGTISPTQIATLTYPQNAVRPFNPDDVANGLDRPTGLVVDHVLSELRQIDQFRNFNRETISNGGYQIHTTIDQKAQAAAEDAANLTAGKGPEGVRNQPENWRSALVAVQPGTGRVLAYYGGPSGTGSDYAGWYYDDEGTPTGVGEHPPGSTMKVYDMIAALKDGRTLDDVFDAPRTKEFPNSQRTKDFPAGPVSNATSAPCQPTCTLSQAAIASLNVPFFDLTEQLGPGKVIDAAIASGIQDMWANLNPPLPTRIDLRGQTGADALRAGNFGTEVGIGQYGITVADQANGYATIASEGNRAPLHFVTKVTHNDDVVYSERIQTTDVGLTPQQWASLNDTLSQVSVAPLNNGWDTGAKTGTWQFGGSAQLGDNLNAHTWTAGYTQVLAAAVWLGTQDGQPLKTRTGGTVGSAVPATIWQQFMKQALATMDNLDQTKKHFPHPTPSPTPPPSDSESPTGPAEETSGPPTASGSGTTTPSGTVKPTSSAPSAG
jgi:membrane peptidoglycan carboxypeptidase